MNSKFLNSGLLNKMIKRLYIPILLLFMVFQARSQNLVFSDYDNLSVLTNPGDIASDNSLSFYLATRRLKILDEINYNSYYGVLSYPITHRRTGRRYGGLALSALTDRYDFVGGLRTSGVGLAYSVKVRLTYLSWISLGLQGVYYHKGFDESRFTTGSQWDSSLGYISGSATGEGSVSESIENFTLNSGLYWHQNNEQDLLISYFGLGAFNINRSEEHYISNDVKLPLLISLQGGRRFLLKKNTMLMPAFLYLYSNNQELVNFSATYTYFFNNDCKCFNLSTGSIDVIARYQTSKRISVGARYNQDNYSVSLNYDTGFDSDIMFASTSALEICLGARIGGKKPPAMRKKYIEDDYIPEFSDSTSHDTYREFKTIDEVDSEAKYTENDVREKNMLIDSLRKALTKDKVNFKLSVDLKFDFNDTTLNEYAKNYLIDLCRILVYNSEFKVKILGHADPTGQKVYNEMLSKKRAKAVYRFIIQNGVSSERLEYIGKGSQSPRYDTKKFEERGKNRRVEFIIYNTPSK